MTVSPDPPAQDVASILQAQLVRNRNLRTEAEPDKEHRSMLAKLREWQTGRLSQTYSDLLNNARYRPAAEFFLSDIYGVRDFTRRDEDIERVYPLMVKLLPEAALRTIALAIEANALTMELDRSLAHALVKLLGRRKSIDDRSYAQAYRDCANRAERARQIDLILLIGRSLDTVVAKPMIYHTLRLLRKPAQAAGFGELQNFLERGFVAFRHMGGANPFLETIRHREQEILERIYASTPSPFDIEIIPLPDW